MKTTTTGFQGSVTEASGSPDGQSLPEKARRTDQTKPMTKRGPDDDQASNESGKMLMVQS